MGLGSKLERLCQRNIHWERRSFHFFAALANFLLRFLLRGRTVKDLVFLARFFIGRFDRFIRVLFWGVSARLTGVS